MGDDPVVARTAVDRVWLHLKLGRAWSEAWHGNQIVPGSTREQVEASIIQEQIVAILPVDRIVAGVARKEVVSGTAEGESSPSCSLL
jgi:hypothetical protein